MIDICAFFEYTTDVSRGKMVTIYRKNLLASCLFLLGYSSFFLLAVSGSYDYTASGALASELEPTNLEKHRNEWLSNHEWDYSSLKGNYHSRRKSRSTLKNETSRVEGERIVETSQGVEGEWMPRKERTVERFVGSESIGNASGFVQEEKEKEDSDAIKNMTTTTTMTTIEPIKSDINLENETRKEVSNDEKNEKKDHLEKEVSVEEGKEKKNATENLGLRSMISRFPTKLGQEGSDEESDESDESEDEGYPNRRVGSNMKILTKKLLKEILKRKGHHHRNVGKKIEVSDIELENSENHDEDFKDKEEEENKDFEEESKDSKDQNEEKDLKESKNENSQTVTELFNIMSNIFTTMKNKNNAFKHYPWRALTSTKYTKQVTKQEGPHLKESTKESKSKMSLFFADDFDGTFESEINLTNSSKMNDSDISITDRPINDTLSERIESIEETTIEPIETTTEQMEITTTEPTILYKKTENEPIIKNIGKTWIIDGNDVHEVTIYRYPDTKILLVTRVLDSNDWY